MTCTTNSVVQKSHPGSLQRGAYGFTLIELMVVLTIIATLVGIAAVNYSRSMVNAREAVLKQDLQALRGAIQQFTLDKQRAPQSLEDMASAGYLREVPTDPVTHQKDWHLDFEDVMLSPDQTGSGLSDVHSNSDAVSPNQGTAYNTW